MKAIDVRYSSTEQYEDMVDVEELKAWLLEEFEIELDLSDKKSLYEYAMEYSYRENQPEPYYWFEPEANKKHLEAFLAKDVEVAP